MTPTKRPLVVPYIAPWSGERTAAHLLVHDARGTGIVYADEHPFDRDSHGVLYKRTLHRPGVGDPLLGDVHGPRQRRAMRKLLCQVCGRAADRDARGWLWLLRADPRTPEWPEGEMTTHPPLCRRCARISVRQCPHLNDQAVAARVGRPEIDHVLAVRYRKGGTAPEPAGHADVVPIADPAIRWYLATQLVATLTGCTVVDLKTELGDRSSAV
ncbi:MULTISPECIES: hypothetical protein [Streptomycetaceae]|uniref:Uncharacterized protein n=1 Tax=Streptantibioticus cattleyicolor (strain ATCC 35852 / DSM 46488 / JCM 4925 / NBRC 14057 / NRRL 8057) TaxID=1003195 RepID=F8JRZ5_STREN|nr:MULTISPECIES: hypothetical protein [Streptomycetaceae]AEW92906.1 hypothetical protein SCATT_05350 [Streptantibioticus cattleyicolor NRRL 8057 = DSM 46488]MYS57656.1 hypothetical protein [Streptomyces sp. SID5468]CCB73263.1 conserved protein of unknown function [Streptantibioticus cattleyicolor NRRL 8057 = DSM 46488]